MRLDQERQILLAPPHVAAGGERRERVAVIGLAPRDDVMAFLFAALHEILPGDLHRRFHRLRAARHEIAIAEIGGRLGAEEIGELFGGLGGEEPGVRIGDALELRADRRAHLSVRMAEAGDGGAPARVEIALALLVDDVGAVPVDGGRNLGAKIAVDDVSHGWSA